MCELLHAFCPGFVLYDQFLGYAWCFKAVTVSVYVMVSRCMQSKCGELSRALLWFVVICPSCLVEAGVQIFLLYTQFVRDISDASCGSPTVVVLNCEYR